MDSDGLRLGLFGVADNFSEFIWSSFGFFGVRSDFSDLLDFSDSPDSNKSDSDSEKSHSEFVQSPSGVHSEYSFELFGVYPDFSEFILTFCCSFGFFGVLSHFWDLSEFLKFSDFSDSDGLRKIRFEVRFGLRKIRFGVRRQSVHSKY